MSFRLLYFVDKHKQIRTSVDPVSIFREGDCIEEMKLPVIVE